MSYYIIICFCLYITVIRIYIFLYLAFSASEHLRAITISLRHGASLSEHCVTLRLNAYGPTQAALAEVCLLLFYFNFSAYRYGYYIFRVFYTFYYVIHWSGCEGKQLFVVGNKTAFHCINHIKLVKCYPIYIRIIRRLDMLRLITTFLKQEISKIIHPLV